MNAPFPIQPELTQIALAYRNARMIADEVLPRHTVGIQEFKYQKYDKEDRFTIPDTRVGRKGVPGEVEFGASELTDSCQGYGLDAPIPQTDIDNAASNPAINPVGQAVEGTTDLILLDREQRVSSIVFEADTYATGNKVQLAGDAQWSDFDGSDPIDDIMSALDSMMMRPNTMVLGLAVWTKLRRHPKIAKAIHGNSGDVGIVARQATANLFEVDRILVGESWINTVKPGHTARYSRLWGKHCALLHIDPTAHTQSGRITFGLTAQWMTRIAGSTPDPKIGLLGGQRVRVGEFVKELVVANDVGYFIEDAVA